MDDPTVAWSKKLKLEPSFKYDRTLTEDELLQKSITESF
jgi:hypothetical protein